jgi:hypothetical protein
MAKKKTTKKTAVSDAQKLGIGVGLTAAAVAAAGAYFLYGADDAKKTRKKVKSGILRAKAEVLEALENAQEITEDEFHDLIDGVVKSYGKVQSLSKKDLKDFKEEMSGNWGELVQSGVAKVLTVEQIAKKVAKRKETTKPTKKKTVAKSSSKKKTTKKAVKKSVKKKTTKKVTKKK